MDRAGQDIVGTETTKPFVGLVSKDVFMTLSSGDATSQLDICLEDTATKRLR